VSASSRSRAWHRSGFSEVICCSMQQKQSASENWAEILNWVSVEMNAFYRAAGIAAGALRMNKRDATKRIKVKTTHDHKADAETGACIYNAGGKTYCANLTQEQCSAIKGTWLKGEECPPPKSEAAVARLSGVVSTIKEIRDLGSGGWFFPRGIDFLDVSVDAKTGQLEVKLSGGPQTQQASVLTMLDHNSIQAAVQFAAAMEHVRPPKPLLDPSDPRPGPPVSHIPSPLPSPTLKDVASYWSDACLGKDTYDNNCAHFLSDAFIRSGFSELKDPNDCIEARCEPASRPLRARNMWCWFKKKAKKTSSQPTRNTGWWTVFQLDEKVYWGGHVALLDTDSWTYYGTGWYSKWSQHLYQW
jgi:hypothetical protein